MVIMYASDSVLRKNAFRAFKKVDFFYAMLLIKKNGSSLDN